MPKGRRRPEQNGPSAAVADAVDTVQELITRIANYHCRRNCSGEDQELDDLLQYADTVVRPAVEKLMAEKE